MKTSLKPKSQLTQSGFTLPEVVIVMGMSALFVGLILFFGISYWRYGFNLESDADTLVTRLNAQDYLREQIGSSSGLINQNGIPDNPALNPDTTIAGSNYWTVLHAVPTTYTSGGTGTTPILYYKRSSETTSHAYIMNGAQPYEDEYVLYIDKANKQLMVRFLPNPSAVGNRLKKSCTPANASSTCPADKVIATDVSSISTRFFSRSGNLIDWTSAFDSNSNKYIGPDYSNVEVAEFTIKLAQRASLEKTNTTQNTTVIRIALRNT